MVRSNSRRTVASPPPRDRLQDRAVVRCRAASGPPQIQSSPSAAASASRSSRMSHSGAVRAVALERRRPPQAARVLGVFPEVVELVARAGRQRGCCPAGRRSPPDRRGPWRKRASPKRSSVFAFCASTQAMDCGAVDVLKPDPGIVVGGFQSGARIGVGMAWTFPGGCLAWIRSIGQRLMPATTQCTKCARLETPLVTHRRSEGRRGCPSTCPGEVWISAPVLSSSFSLSRMR